MDVLETRIRSSPTIGSAGPRSRAWIESVSSRPVFASLLCGLRIRVSGRDAPRLTITAGEIQIADGFVENDEGAEWVLRYACEVSLLMRLGVDDSVLVVLMAARVTRLAIANAGQERRNRYLRQAPSQLLDAMNGMAEPYSPEGLLKVARVLLELEGKALPPCDPREIVAKLREYSYLCAPAEYLLVQGGDARLTGNPETGRSIYGCQPFPESAGNITFASSTATSISEGAYAAVEHCRRRLLSRALGGDFSQAVGEEFNALRDELLRYFDLTNDRVDIALSPSGTDSHLQALAIARLRAGSRPILGIVTAPNETGSGVSFAVSGRHFAHSTALDGRASRGAPIDGLGGDNVTLASIPIRDEAGRPLGSDTLVESMTRLITQAHRSGQFVLLQVLDVSKTGLVTPGLRKLRELVEAFPDNLLIVVDACQLRVANDILAQYIDLGALVCITASKFFTAPPFAGALLIPCSKAPEDRASTTLAPGCGAYFAKTDWPSRWRAAAALPVGVNLGVLMRWRAGLHEMREFERVPPVARRHILASLGGAIAMSIKHAALFELVESPGRVQVEETLRGEWDEVQSIFSFRVRRPAPESYDFLTLAELRSLHSKMSEDVTEMLSPDASPLDQRVARLRCHIGQPVVLADTSLDDVPTAIRISTSARLVSHIWAQGDAATARTRLSEAMAHFGHVLRKLSLLHHQMFGKGGEPPFSDSKSQEAIFRG